MKRTSYQDIPATMSADDFQAAAKRLAEIKQEAGRLSAEKQQITSWICEQLGLQADAEGTSRYLAGDFDVKVTTKLTRSIDEDKLTEIVEGNNLHQIAEQVIRWKPSLDLTGYKRLDPETRSLFDEAIITKPAAPFIVVAPTDKSN